MKPAIQIPEYPHALLSPSKAHMWLNCPGSLGASKGAPRSASSKYAAEGTVYHDVSRRALIEGKDCSAYVGDRYEVSGFEFVVDADNAEQAQVYVDLVRSLPGKRFVEVELEYSKLLGVPKTVEIPSDPAKVEHAYSIPVAAGTGDNVTIDFEARVIYGVDLKFGRGDIVYAEKNPQVRLYMAAAVAKFDLLGITDDWKAVGVISQPRAGHYDSETLTVGELRAWVEAQKPAANRAYTLWTQGPERINPELHLEPGEKQCRWCPLSGRCVAQSAKIIELFPKGHAEAAIPTLPQLDDVQVAEALSLADEIEHWLSAVRAEGLRRALAGHVLPNWKLVQGRRGNRALNEEARVQLEAAALIEMGMEEVEGDSELPVSDALHFALGDAAYKPRTLKTVAQLEKPLAKKAPLLWAALQAHITQADGAPALERMEDPRPPLVIVSQEFPSLEGATGLL